MNIRKTTPECTIKKVEITEEKISGRGGLPFFLRYADSIGAFSIFETMFGNLRKSKKGLPVESIVRQLIAFMSDGSNTAVSYFNHLKKDEGYAAVLESKESNLLSSHSVKRFFQCFTSLKKSNKLRKVLIAEFIRQLKALSPDRIVLDIDTMVLDNSESDHRHGVKPTYKKGIKGFQNLQITWGGILVDALFRNGSAHSNHGNDVAKLLGHVIKTIRKEYRSDVPITITMDSGFFSEENLVFLAGMGVTFIAMGKMYNDLKEKIKTIQEKQYTVFEGKKDAVWRHAEFFDKRDSWKLCDGFRVVHTQLITEDNGQTVLDFIRQDSLIYTNNEAMTQEEVVTLAHGRGASELTNRSFKSFLTKETLPFKNFGMNAAWYYFSAIAHSLLIAFRNDVLAKVSCVTEKATPNTIRRQVFDVAAKIIRKSNRYILKFTRGVFARLNASMMWDLVNQVRAPIPILQ